ncbi:MAG: YitT family protein [Clostridia bacterium]|nr:YitT family protein [Clostridia bacterium]
MKKPFKFNIDPKTLLVDLLFDVIGSILYAAGVYNFAYVSDFAPGGVTGLAVLLNTLTKGLPFLPGGVPIGAAMIIINIPIILFCFKALGLDYFLRSAKTILISSFVLDCVAPHLWLYKGEPMLAAIFGGILAGAGLALIYMRLSSTGGSDFIIIAIQKKRPHLSLGLVSLFVDGVVILLVGVVYGTVDAALYGLLMTLTYSVIIDKITLGNSSRKLVTAVTEKSGEITERIMGEIERGVTVMKGKGAYTGDEKDVLLCACSKVEVFGIKRIIFETDKDAFVMISTIDQTYGEGFKSETET